jgi:metallo-beta-lactamase class B
MRATLASRPDTTFLLEAIVHVRRPWNTLVVAALVAACASNIDVKPSSASVEAAVMRATALAGDDLKPLLALCQPQPAVRIAGDALDRLVERVLALPYAEPGQAFDNLYFFASGFVSAWALQTSDGIILFDAMDDEREARDIIESGMRRMRLDPATIRYIVITHAHGDHYGGATYLADKYKARLIASDADWQQMGGTLEFASRLWPAPPPRDLTVADGQQLRLGDATVTFFITPGHTLGTLSPVIDVPHLGKRHKALLWGGTAFNFGRDVPRLDSYIAQTERLRKVATDTSIDVLISNHASYDSAVAKLDLLRTRGRDGANPFVIGTPGVDRSLEVMGTCARAQRERFLAQG